MIRKSIVAAASLVLLGAGAAFADPPATVGRLAYTEGIVSFRAADQDQWAPATVNYPVTSGDAVSTAADAKAEIQIGPTEIFLDGSSALEVFKIDESGTELRVEGVAHVFQPVPPSAGVQISSPQGTISLLQPGRYHIEAADRTQIAVLEGEARVEGDAPLDLHAGQSAILGGDPAETAVAAARRTPFDAWAQGRAQNEVVSATPQYVSPDTTGYQDLDNAGRWNTVPTYGAVWFPSEVPVDWAPYRYGHWAFVPPWGWTWIDDAPWGFAPFHFGRWVVIEHRWAWWPGPRVGHPCFAPALVAFLGTPGWSMIAVAPHARPVGWVPLAPFEAFHPQFRASAAFVQRINAVTVNNTVVNNVTVNHFADAGAARFANRDAATVVPASAFTRSAPVRQARLAVPRDEIARATATNEIGHVRPNRAATVTAPVTTDRAVRIAHAPLQTAAAPLAPAARIWHRDAAPSIAAAQPRVAPPVQAVLPTVIRPPVARAAPARPSAPPQAAIGQATPTAAPRAAAPVVVRSGMHPAPVQTAPAVVRPVAHAPHPAPRAAPTSPPQVARQSAPQHPVASRPGGLPQKG